MSEEKNLRQLRVLHVVGPDGVPGALQQSLFMPLLTRMPKARVKAQIASLAPGAVPEAVLRQSGIPVHDIALSRKRFSFGGIGALVEATRQFRPDVIQAWGHSAQAASAVLRGRCDWKVRVVWSVGDTQPLARDAGFLDKQTFKLAARYAPKADRIVYTSDVAAAYHRRVGFPDGGHLVIAPGVDATRFKPDFNARRKVREQLKLPHDAFVIGMMAPFQPEYDHANFFKGVGELIKTNPEICILLAGHGVQKGNAPLMAIVGGGQLGQRTQLLGEWSDVAAFYNACDLACSTATIDAARIQLVIAMLCGVPCVATGMGAQGEVIGSFGVAIEPGSPAALVRGINRVLLNTPEKRAFMAQGARKHALENYIYVRSMQKYLQLYYDLVGRQSLVTEDVPTPQIDATVNVPPPLPKLDGKPVKIAELRDPDSIEEKVRAADVTYTARTPPKAEPRVGQAKASEGDVLETFARNVDGEETKKSPMNERARGGVADDEHEDLLPQDAIEAPAPAVLRAPSKARTGVNAGTAAALAGPPPGTKDASKDAKPAAASPKPVAAPAPNPVQSAAPMPTVAAEANVAVAAEAKPAAVEATKAAPPVEVKPAVATAPPPALERKPAAVRTMLPPPVPVPVAVVDAAPAPRSSRPAAVPVTFAAVDAAPTAVAPVVAAPGMFTRVIDAPVADVTVPTADASLAEVKAVVADAPVAEPTTLAIAPPQVPVPTFTVPDTWSEAHLPETSVPEATMPEAKALEILAPDALETLPVVAAEMAPVAPAEAPVVLPPPPASAPDLSLADTLSLFASIGSPAVAEPAQANPDSPPATVAVTTAAESYVTPSPEAPSPQLDLLVDPLEEPKRAVGQSS